MEYRAEDAQRESQGLPVCLEASDGGGFAPSGFVSQEVAGLRVTVGWLLGVVMGFVVGCAFWAVVVG